VPELAADVRRVNGLRGTPPARTGTDIARTAGRDASVTVADAALSGGIIPADELGRSLDRSAGGRGIRRARHAMSLVDGKSESVAESLSRLTFREIGRAHV